MVSLCIIHTLRVSPHVLAHVGMNLLSHVLKRVLLQQLRNLPRSLLHQIDVPSLFVVIKAMNGAS